ncbi:hypothetical protein H6X68_07620 [Actinomyces sp. 186855]|nr:hypothetical protein [Actinomyces sp. AC-20-1]MCL3789151.1 hypothetical protein [Actinomyces sp. 187325]MCL3792445.1 hypothetical protein [Actinomyces sp. 186855]MCL3794222.1 hypothetical protein [Actinomyces sp. 217892]
MITRTLAASLCLVAGLGLAACGSSDDSMSDNKPAMSDTTAPDGAMGDDAMHDGAMSDETAMSDDAMHDGAMSDETAMSDDSMSDKK